LELLREEDKNRRERRRKKEKERKTKGKIEVFPNLKFLGGK
jgi:hypothetical protein